MKRTRVVRKYRNDSKKKTGRTVSELNKYKKMMGGIGLVVNILKPEKLYK